MENRKATAIRRIEKTLTNEALTLVQRKALNDFDRFNDLERGASLSTRVGYLTTLYKLGKSNKKPFEEINKQDLKEFLSVMKAIEKKSSFELRKAHLKRFFRWLCWNIEGEDGKHACISKTNFCSYSIIFIASLFPKAVCCPNISDLSFF